MNDDDNKRNKKQFTYNCSASMRRPTIYISYSSKFHDSNLIIFHVILSTFWCGCSAALQFLNQLKFWISQHRIQIITLFRNIYHIQYLFAFSLSCFVVSAAFVVVGGVCFLRPTSFRKINTLIQNIDLYIDTFMHIWTLVIWFYSKEKSGENNFTWINIFNQEIRRSTMDLK